MSKPTKNTDAQWAKHFAAVLAIKGTKPTGEGWMTRKEFQAVAQCGEHKAQGYLKAEVKAGRMEAFAGNEGGGRKVWYRPIAPR